MPITIAKDAGAGAGSDTTYTIRNFENLAINEDIPVDTIQNVAAAEEDTVLIQILGPMMQISFDWTIMDETSSVVSGAGGSVTTALAQQAYLYDTFAPTGTSAINDLYTITIDYGGGVTFVRTGRPTKISAVMSGNEPLTFKGHMDLVVGQLG